MIQTNTRFKIRYFDGHEIRNLSYSESMSLFEQAVADGHKGVSLSPDLVAPYKAP